MPETEASNGSDERSPRQRFMAALRVVHNGKVGVVTGVAFAALTYGVFVLLPGASATDAALNLVLAFTIAVGTAILVTLILTARRAAALTMNPRKWVRRGGTAAVVGGMVWAVAGLAAPVVATVLSVGPTDYALPGVLGGGYALALSVAPFLIIGGVWALHTVHRAEYARLGPVVGVVAALGAVVAAVGFVLAGWVAFVDAPAYLGAFARGVPFRTFAIVVGLVGLGSTVQSGVALGLGRLARGPTIALLLTFPMTLAGLTAVVIVDAPALVAPATTVPLGLGWTAVGRELRAGRGVPSRERFEARRPSIPGTDPDPETVGDSPGA